MHYNDIINYVGNLSKRICTIFNIVPPTIKILVDPGQEFNGAMIPKRNRTNMYIELTIPHTIDFPRDKAEITAIIIHEHCHYQHSMQLSNSARMDSLRLYMQNSRKRREDEEQTWTCTKRTARKLNLWTKDIFKKIQENKYTEHLTF